MWAGFAVSAPPQQVGKGRTLQEAVSLIRADRASPQSTIIIITRCRILRIRVCVRVKIQTNAVAITLLLNYSELDSLSLYCEKK